MAVNLRDVARRAGVSTPTASRVLSGSDYPVAHELRERVEQAARELDYVPNAQAQALLRSSSHTIGVLVGAVDDPYFAEIVNGVQALATARQLMVTVCDTQRDIERELEYFRLLQAHRTSVVIIAGSGLVDNRYTAAMSARTRSFQKADGRVVAIGNPGFEVDRVLVDNASGARELGAHLVDLRHREVAMLAGPANVSSTLERIGGLREAVEGAGGRLHVRYGAPTRDSGWFGAEQVLAEHPEVTAMVGSADQMAIGSMAYLHKQGRSVPEEMSVAGFNDIAVAKDLHPSLTTVRLPLRTMGETALRLATTPVPEDESLVRTLSVELVVRESTGVART